MKSRKVLLGLLLGVCACFAGTATAQKANFQSTKLIEIGPDNVAGRITSLVVTGHDATTQNQYVTHMYAGSATGGLFYCAEGVSNWEYVPCYVDGEELTLPISSMVKLNDSTIVIATGESLYAKGNKLNKMSALGRGIFLFNTVSREFAQVAGTNPGTDMDHHFASINTMSFMVSDGITYFYVATEKGLYRWTIAQASDWNNAPVSVFDGAVRDVKVSNQFNRAFFTSEGHVYKISDVISSRPPVDISGSCSAFGGAASDVVLALAPSDETYLYAAAFNKNGLMTGLYLTRNTNSWQLISTSTVTPFTSVATAKTCGAIAVSPNDPMRVVIGGANVFVGKGYVEDNPFQWMQTSQNESQLNYGNYMSTVYSNSAFCHSGIHQIVPNSYWWDTYGMMKEEYYFVTDGGIYLAVDKSCSDFMSMNIGLNTVQINSLAVAPDGTIISGANGNACPLIESRMDHSGGHSDSAWYDPQGSVMNHRANIIWDGNGGAVAASRFNQYVPISRRPMFVSAANGFIGRTYADFADYTNTQTWTAGEAFMSDKVVGGPAIGQIYLWETTHNVESNDSMIVLIDTMSYAYREGSEPFRMALNTEIHAGDSMVVLDTAHAFYPYYYTFDHNFVVKDELRHKAHRPYLSRMLAVGKDIAGADNTYLYYSWTPTDFRKVYDNSNDTRFWTHIYMVSLTASPHTYIRQGVISQDGDCAIVVVENDSLQQSYLARVHGLNSANYNLSVSKTCGQLDCMPSTRITTFDTIMVDGEKNYFFGRRISSISVDPRQGKDAVIVTFDGYGSDAANVVYIENASKENYVIHSIPLPVSIPAYSAIIEYTTGAVFVGTEDGVYTASDVTNPGWQPYGAFKGVPVTAMYQVTVDNEQMTHVGHDGVTPETYVFPRTKWPFALYFGTYGRGIFMDSTYVTRHENEIVDSNFWSNLGIPTVTTVGANSLRFYPNPAVESATLELNVAVAGEAVMTIYDLSGKKVRSERLGKLAEGVHTRTIDCQQLQHGMYLVNVVMGNQTATSKLIVR